MSPIRAQHGPDLLEVGPLAGEPFVEDRDSLGGGLDEHRGGAELDSPLGRPGALASKKAPPSRQYSSMRSRRGCRRS